jgi:glycosyltransferase involved in cell wall biosynthesis
MGSSQKRIINLVDGAGERNVGIWNAAISTAEELARHSWSTEIWFPGTNAIPDTRHVTVRTLASIRISLLRNLIRERKLNISADIIVTHGCWRYCTSWGKVLSDLGFTWIYTPHGMLESWALRQKSIRKSVYFKFFEQPKASNAAVIRAVSGQEQQNLQKYFPHNKIAMIPNGVEINSPVSSDKGHIRQFLFLGRIHKKKGVTELVSGWLKSNLAGDGRSRLIIAGPDDGELSNLNKLLRSAKNIEYLGPVFGRDKTKLFAGSTFFLLPSYSEGFPTTVLEAMSFGLYPFVSSGCNLPPSIFSERLAIRMEPDADQIAGVLNRSMEIDDQEIKDVASKVRGYVTDQFSIKRIADQQLELYSNLLLR